MFVYLVYVEYNFSHLNIFISMNLVKGPVHSEGAVVPSVVHEDLEVVGFGEQQEEVHTVVALIEVVIEPLQALEEEAFLEVSSSWSRFF